MPTATMKALRKVRPEKGAPLESVAIPVPGPTEVVVRVCAPHRSAGTDRDNIDHGDPWSASRIHPPMTFGQGHPVQMTARLRAGRLNLDPA